MPCVHRTARLSHNPKMPDQIDDAQHEDARLLAQALAAARRTGHGPAPTGACLYCGERQPDSTARWCSVDCRDGWQKERAALLRNAPVGKGGPQP